MDLFAAIEAGQTIGPLLQGNVDLTALNAEGKSLLHVAMRKAKKSEWTSPVLMLLKKGIDPDIKDSAGRTALEDVIELYKADLHKFEATAPDKAHRVVYRHLVERTLRPLMRMVEEHKGAVPWNKARPLGVRKGGLGCLGAVLLLGVGGAALLLRALGV